jgi:biopolymer transport protein ExbD
MQMIDFDLFTGRDKSPDMTPMIDMVFLLLVFFLLTSVFKIPAVETELPSSSQAAVVKPEEFVISVKSDGKIFLNESEVSEDGLVVMLERIVLADSEKNIFIASDRDVSFERIIEVMDIAKKAGAESVSFLTEDEK